MPREKKEQKLQEEEPQTVPFLVYLKGFVLIGAVLFGMFFINRASEKQQESKEPVKSVTLDSISQLQNAFSKEKIQEQIDHEMRTNEGYKEAVSLIEGKRDEVLGEATKATDQVVENSKQAFFDYMYEHTVGAVIKRIVEQMPEEQKEKLIEDVK